MTILKDEIVSMKAFEHANLIFTEPLALTIETCWIYCKTLNLIFSKTNLRLIGVYVLCSISRTLHDFSAVFFSICRILQLKNGNRVLLKNGSFANKMYCGLTALFVKTKYYFCHSNLVNKQINIPSIVFSYRL